MPKVKNRPKRTPIGRRNVLTVNKRDPGFEYRWVNDEDGRIQMFEEAGYEAVREPTDVGDPKAGDASQMDSVCRKPVGGGTTAVLMKIPKEFYEEDQAAKEKQLAEKEKALLQEANGEGFYGEGLKIKHRSKVQIE